MCTEFHKAIQDLNAEVRFLRRALLGIAVCAAVLVFSAAQNQTGAQNQTAETKTKEVPVQSEISTNSLSIRSKSGKKLAWLGETDGGTSLELYDGKSTERLGNDTLRAHLYASKSGEAGISLTDREGRMRTRLSLDEDGHPRIWFTNETEHNIFEISELEKGGVEFSLNDSDGNEIVELMTHGDGSADLEIRAKAHDGAVLIAVSPDGKPIIGAKDKNSVVRTQVGLGDDGVPFILIFNKEGQLVFRYPN